MKNIFYKGCLLLLLTASITSCSSQRFKGSASDTTGTNGATNGTLKSVYGKLELEINKRLRSTCHRCKNYPICKS